MLRTKAIRKMFITTLSLFIILAVISIPTYNKEEVIRTNYEIDSIVGLANNNIYLLNSDLFLVKTKIFLEANKLEDKVREVINNLIDKDNNKIPNGLRGVIPHNTKIKNIIIDKNICTIDFSKEILKVKVDREKQMITTIVYSLLELDEISGVKILVEGEKLERYPNTKEELADILDKKIGINNKYLINSRKDILKVVVYYLEKIDDVMYYVPVTKYVNDERDKIKVIIEELTTSYIYEANLMSFVNSKVELLDYKEEGDVLFLNFNDYLYDKDDKILEEVVYSIAYSVFDNYDVNMVMFEVNDKEVEYVSRNDI